MGPFWSFSPPMRRAEAGGVKEGHIPKELQPLGNLLEFQHHILEKGRESPEVEVSGLSVQGAQPSWFLRGKEAFGQTNPGRGDLKCRDKENRVQQNASSLRSLHIAP